MISSPQQSRPGQARRPNRCRIKDERGERREERRGDNERTVWKDLSLPSLQWPDSQPVLFSSVFKWIFLFSAERFSGISCHNNTAPPLIFLYLFDIISLVKWRTIPECFPTLSESESNVVVCSGEVRSDWYWNYSLEMPHCHSEYYVIMSLLWIFIWPGRYNWYSHCSTGGQWVLTGQYVMLHNFTTNIKGCEEQVF